MVTKQSQAKKVAASPVASLKTVASAKVEAVPQSARERILATARDLIYREGARAVGIDRIVAESGVSKMSLYRWFPSKDLLIVAVLEAEEQRILKAWDAGMERYAGDPLLQLRGQFKGLLRAINSPAYRGCAFLNAAMAFADENHPTRTVVNRFKEEIQRRMTALTKAIGARQPELLAEQLCLVADGAHASGQAVGKDGPSKQIESVVDALINAQLP